MVFDHIALGSILGWPPRTTSWVAFGGMFLLGILMLVYRRPVKRLYATGLKDDRAKRRAGANVMLQAVFLVAVGAWGLLNLTIGLFGS